MKLENRKNLAQPSLVEFVINLWLNHKCLMGCPRTFFENTGRNSLLWNSLYCVYIQTRIICRIFSGFVIGCPCGVWGRGLTDCWYILPLKYPSLVYFIFISHSLMCLKRTYYDLAIILSMNMISDKKQTYNRSWWVPQEYCPSIDSWHLNLSICTVLM